MRRFQIALIMALACGVRANAAPVAITGATLVDFSHYGRSEKDIDDAVVVIEGDRVVAVGPSATTPIPKGARRIEARGAFLVPGMIEGFGALRDQGFANAYLYEGVTTVYLPVPDGSDDRRGKAFLTADPTPHVFLGAAVTGYSETGKSINDVEPPKGHGPDVGALTQERLGGDPLTRAQIATRVRQVAAEGARGVWIDYDVWPHQVDAVVAAAGPLHVGTIGELGFTSSPYAIRAGVGTLVHEQRYLSALASPVDQLHYADDPFGPGADSAVKAECSISPTSEAAAALGAQLSASRTTLMPTLALDAMTSTLDGVPNPWKRPAAALISSDQLFMPADKVTGRLPVLAGLSPERRELIDRCTRNMLALSKALHAAGARFLAASGTSAFGVMPGGGMHLEVGLLQQYVGLSPREAIAAATSNYADAYGWPDVGRIEPGRYADILILNADPRLDVSALESIRTVIFAGRVLDREQLLRLRHPTAKSE